MFARNQALLQRNLDVWRQDAEQYERDVTIAAFHSRFFRWHSSGDIPDAAYLAMMVRVAQTLPNTSFLAFTKKFELINAYIQSNGVLPENLHVVFSAWGSFMPVNPYDFPIAYVKLRRVPCHIPDDAFLCPKYCGECVMSGCSCWDLKPRQAVCFNEH